MNIKKTLVTASSVLAVLLTTSASALVIDFAGMADGAYGEKGGQPLTFDNGDQASLGSLVITAKGYSLDSATTPGTNILSSAFAYMDRGDAGLGVCKGLNGDQCAPSSDDNVTDDEVLWLNFSSAVTIDAISFVNGGHGTSFDAAADFGLNIGVPNLADAALGTTYDLTASFSGAGLSLTGTDFVFSNINGSNSNPWVYYINTLTISDTTTTTVPEPALLGLMVMGLVGVVGVSRKRTRI